MWLNLDTQNQYRFEEEISPPQFFEHLPNLLTETDILVLGYYDARPDILNFLQSEAIPPRWNQFFPVETWDLNRTEHPNGASFHLHAGPRILSQLMGFANDVSEHIDLCDHMAAYSHQHPLLIYHGAFREPLFVSTVIPRTQVEAFSRGIGVSFCEINFDKEYGHLKSRHRRVMNYFKDNE